MEREAFEELIQAHFSEVLGLCGFILQDAHEAEDCAQQAFLKAYAAIDELDPARGGFGPWVRRIARNCCIDLLRRKRRWAPLTQPGRMEDEARPLDAARADELQGAIAELPAQYRVVLHCRYQLGLNSTEIGERLELKPQTVRMRLHRAVKLLRKRLAP